MCRFMAELIGAIGAVRWRRKNESAAVKMVFRYGTFVYRHLMPHKREKNALLYRMKPNKTRRASTE